MARKRLFHRLQEFILVWPGDENLQIGFNGDVMIVPPHDTVAELGQGKPYRFESVKDQKGLPIPGTIILTDRIQETGPSGGYRKIFDAAEACAWMEDTREDLFNRGMAIVMRAEDVGAAMEEGRPKYEASQEENAREILMQELERQKKWDGKGVPAPPSSSEHKIRWALAFLETREQARPQVGPDALKRALAGHFGAPIPENKVPEQPKAMLGSVPKEEAPKELPVGELFEMATAAGIKLSKIQMTRLLENDQEFRTGLIEQIAEKQEGERVGA